MTEREIFFEAVEIATAEARAAYLQGACGQDVALRRKVEELLKEHFSNDSLLAGPALERGRADTVESALREAPLGVIGRYKLLQKIGEGGCGTSTWRSSSNRCAGAWRSRWSSWAWTPGRSSPGLRRSGRRWR